MMCELSGQYNPQIWLCRAGLFQVFIQHEIIYIASSKVFIILQHDEGEKETYGIIFFRSFATCGG